MALFKRLGCPTHIAENVELDLASCLEGCGRGKEAIAIKRDIYSRRKRAFGISNEETLLAAHNLACALNCVLEVSEAKSVAGEHLPVARRALGADHAVTLAMAHMHAYASARTHATQDELVFAERLLEDTVARMRRVFGHEHPHTRNAEGDLTEIRRHIANL